MSDGGSHVAVSTLPPGLQGPQWCRQRCQSSGVSAASLRKTIVNSRPPPRRAFPEASPPVGGLPGPLSDTCLRGALPRSVRLLLARMRTAISIFPPAGFGICVLYARGRSTGGCGGKWCCVMVRCKSLVKTLSPPFSCEDLAMDPPGSEVLASNQRRGARARAGTGGVYGERRAWAPLRRRPCVDAPSFRAPDLASTTWLATPPTPATTLASSSSRLRIKPVSMCSRRTSGTFRTAELPLVQPWPSTLYHLHAALLLS